MKERVYIIVREDSNGLREPVTCFINRDKAVDILHILQSESKQYVNTWYRLAEVDYEL